MSVLLVCAIALSFLACGGSGDTVTAKANGFGGEMTVEVAFDGESIKSVEVKKHSETQGISDPAFNQIPQSIVDNQSIALDYVAGASVTSKAILDAVEKAIVEAGFDVNNYMGSVASTGGVFDAPLTNDPVPSSWDETYDVVVVGGGFAGLAAAQAAQANDAETVLIEKMSRIGGNSAINGGQYAAYTSSIAADFQEKFNLEPDTAEQHIEDTIVGGDNLPLRELVEVMVHGSPMYFDKLLENGLKVRETLARPGGHYGFRTYVTENSIGQDIVTVQEKMAKDAGVDIQTNTKLVQIFKDNGRVVGIQVATNDGLKTIKAEKGVILATGGFGANVEMRSSYDAKLDDSIPTTNAISATGEGLVMAMELGAGTRDLQYIQRYPFADPNNGVLDTVAVIPFTGPSYGIVYVDENGERYVNEGERRDVCSDAAVATGGTTTFSILNRKLASWVPDSDIQKGLDTGRIIQGATFEELAKNINAQTYQGKTINIDAATLEDTINKHNSYIDTQVDPDFGKVMASSMVKVEEGPYYAIPQWPSVHHTMGGVNITPNAQVLDVDGNVIPGFFAAGEVTGGLHGTNRLGSNADADANAFGMVAGTYAATGVNPVNVN